MIGAAIRKEVQLVLADRGGLLALFAMPVLFMAVFGAVFGDDGDPEPMTVATFHRPDDRRGAEIVAEVGRSPQLRVEERDSAEAVRTAVAGGDVAAGLIIPPQFSPASGVPAELSIDTASPPQLRAMVVGELQARLARAAFGIENEAILEVRSPPSVKQALPDASGFQVAVPGNAVLFGFFLALTIAISFIDERESGTFQRLAVAPVSRSHILLSKLVPYFLIGMVQMIFLFGFGRIVLGMQIGGSWATLLLLSAAVVACAIALGLLVASFSGTQKQVGGIGSIALLIMGLIGGAMVPRLAMSEMMKTVGLATPHAWALEGFYDVILRQGSGLGDVAGEIAALLAFAAVFAGIGLLRFRFE